LTFVITGFASLIGACKDTIRGFERTDIPAVVHVVQQFLTALLIVPALYLGGSLNVSLAVQIPISMLVLAMIWRSLRPVGVLGLSVSRTEIDALTVMGTPFVFLGLATALQPTIDAIFLSKLAPHDVMGWYAVARQLIGVLLLPATALTGALYPTLCRLHIEDREAFVRVGRGSLSSVALAAVPIAMGCYLFPDIGIALFGRKKYAPSEHNLQMLAAFLFLLYFSIPLGTCIVAANKRKSASFVQALCVVVSVVLDPLLIPLFQRRSGNGGLGVCIASIVSEAVVVVGFIMLAPRGIFDRALVRVLALAMACGGLMALVPYFLRPYLSPFIIAPLSVCVYAGALVLTGAIDKQQMEQLKSGITRKLLRR
jgi:O-antigen/teichoic acid export membrane protein